LDAQQEGRKMASKKSIFDVLARLPLLRLLNLRGRSRVLPEVLEEQLASTGNEDNHLAFES
jgi:hypothetical protein